MEDCCCCFAINIFFQYAYLFLYILDILELPYVIGVWEANKTFIYNIPLAPSWHL